MSQAKRRPRLSQDAATLLTALERRADELYDCDLLIVGSGYGGAVAAARLAGTATRIWLVERGAEHRPGDFPSRFAELPGFVRLTAGERIRGRRQGLLDLRLDGDVSVLLGNGLGGGSLINANVMLEPEPGVFASGWPTGIDAASMSAHYAKALEVLKPQVLPQHLSLRKFAQLKQLGAESIQRCPIAVAWSAPPQASADVPMQPCTLCGDCMTGCNQGAKGSLDTNYLALAEARGVAMFCGVAVQRIAPLNGTPSSGWSVQWQHAEPGAAQPPAIRARRVLLAAGSLGSTEILLRSQKPDLPFSSWLGKGFSSNGDTIAAGLGHLHPTGTVADPESDPADANARQIGPTITGYKRIAETGGRPGFVVQEFAVPGALRRVFGEIVATLGALRGVPMPGEDPALCSEAHIDRMSLYGLMGLDNAAGQLVRPAAARRKQAALPDEEGLLQVCWPNVTKQPVYAAMNDWLALAFPARSDDQPGPRAVGLPRQAIGAGGLLIKLVWRAAAKWLGSLTRSQPKPGIGDRVVEAALGLPEARVLSGEDLMPLLNEALGLAVTVHPLGGCRMSTTVADGVVNHAGQVWDPRGSGCYPGLVVLDGAIVPRALGINPALTITALAERAMPSLRQAWHWPEPTTTPVSPHESRPTPPPPRPARRRELPSPEAVWRLNERLQGPLQWNGRTYWGVMELSFEDIPGFSRALQLPERVLQLREGSLVLHDWTPGQAPGEYHEPDEEDPDYKTKWRVLVSARLSGSLRLLMPLLADQIEGLSPPRLSLDYRLAVQSRWAYPHHAEADLLSVGSSVFARKIVGLRPEEFYDEEPSWIRQLSELDVQFDGKSVGRWALDQGHLANIRATLLRLERHSSLPDALLDAISGAAYMARHLLVPQLLPALAHALEPPQAAHLNERWPADLPDCPVEITELTGCQGARLSRYRAQTQESACPPVLLIHGMGASGSSYTHTSLAPKRVNLVQALRKAGREVWVLDVRSSIANEAGRQLAASADWTAEQIACADIPAAIDHVLRVSKAPQLDLFGHCQGAVMSWIALLDNPGLGAKVHAAVFSQVGPWLRLSSCNRLRALVIGGMLRYLTSTELDACPDFAWQTRDPQGWPVWQRTEPRPQGLLLLDTLLGAYPYPQAGEEAARAQAMDIRHWIPLRHRADAIFGQLFELGNLSNEALEHLDALLGWVKLPMLAQAIHFARLGMITDCEGNNRWLSTNNLQQCLKFPLLILHGRRNRVFDWQGSERSLRLIKKQVYGENMPAPRQETGYLHYGADSKAQLLVFENYGHFDCVIGQYADRDVFPQVVDFLNRPAQAQALQHPQPAMRANSPFIGPALGWLRQAKDAQGRPWLGIRLVLQPKSREAAPAALVLVPVDWRSGQPQPQIDLAVYAEWPAGTERNRPLSLDLWTPWDDAGPGSIAVLLLDHMPPPAETLSLHWCLGSESGPNRARSLAFLPVADTGAVLAIKKCLRDLDTLQDCQIHLGPSQLAAADRQAVSAASPSTTPTAMPALCFALSSCQYPPLQFDTQPAQASFDRLLKVAREANGPQFLLMAGDQVYLDDDAGLLGRPDEMPRRLQQRARRERYEVTWRMPARRRCMTLLPAYPMLDDHEVGDNWGGLKQPVDDKIKADLDAYQAYQHGLAPTARLSASGSYAYRIDPGGVPFFMLDSRSQREPRRNPAQAAAACMIPEADMAALEAALKALNRGPSAGLPKFVLTAAPLLPPGTEWLQPATERLLHDGWSGFPASAQRLLGFIADHDIRRVVLLAGDSHLSSVSRFEFRSQSGADNQLIAITSSGLYTPWPFANQRPDALLPDGADLNLGRDGRYRLEIQSTRPGFALVTLIPGEPGQPSKPDRLLISLRSADAQPIYCDLPLT